MTIALVGNPNSGKTTLFNALTGSNQFVGNWPGVTVEKKQGKLKGEKESTVMDLPGIYSLSPYTLEEVVARNYLVEQRPDVILNIIDGTNLERNLFLTTQILELGIPVVVAINMMDVVRKSGDKLELLRLSDDLGCPVVEISALKGEGIPACIDAVKAQRTQKVQKAHPFSEEVEQALGAISKGVQGAGSEEQQRFFAIKLFERDENIIQKRSVSHEQVSQIEGFITKVETARDDDSVGIITAERYERISEITKRCIRFSKKKKKRNTSDRIDQIVTNRFLALPIFAIVMFLVYYVSITTVGTFATDWTNDVLFGEWLPPLVTGALEAIHTAPWLIGLLVDGILAGVGAVLGFVPQMMVLFAFLAFLEACGYMARIAFIMDRIFRRFGLSGKSFIPILIGTGCGVPGIMASRTIENARDRKMTIMTTTFIPCSAKLPLIGLIAGALFRGAPWVAPSAYFVGMAAIICSGILLKKTKLFAGEAAPFVMELPAYHWPTPLNLLRSVWERSWSFIKKAGTIILLATIAVWFLSGYGFTQGRFGEVEMNDSVLATIGKGIAPLFAPLGWGEWRAAVATFTGLIAKENIVSTLGILFGVAEVSEDGAEIWGTLRESFTPVAAYSFLVFNLLCAPCFAALGAIKREMNNKKWFWIAVGYQSLFAYAVSFCVYQLGALLFTGAFGFWTVLGLLVLVGFLYLLFRSPKKTIPTQKIKNKKVHG